MYCQLLWFTVHNSMNRTRLLQFWTFRRIFLASPLSRCVPSSSVECGKAERTYRSRSTQNKRLTPETRYPKPFTHDSLTISLRSVCQFTPVWLSVLPTDRSSISAGSTVCLNITIWFANLLTKGHIKNGVTVSVRIRVRLGG